MPAHFAFPWFGIFMRSNSFVIVGIALAMAMGQPVANVLCAQQSQEWAGQSNRYPKQQHQNLVPVDPKGQSGPGQLGNFLVPSGNGPDYGLRAGSQFGGDGLQDPGWTNAPQASSGNNPFFQSPGLTVPGGAALPQSDWPEINRQMIDSLGVLDSDDTEKMLEQLRGPIQKRTFETSGRVETIRQRYEDGKVQVERQVTQDREGNYFSHGSWKLFSPDGQTLADGGFQFGMMEGPWERWHAASKDGVFAMQPFEQYQGPFLSTVNFNDGRMDGIWQIFDASRNKIMEIPYELGLRQGMATWWWPNGQKMREIRFDRNRIDGYWVEWNLAGQVQRRDEYIRGRKMVRETLEYAPGKPRYMAWFADAKLVFDELDKWWEAQPAAYVSSGKKTQHGPVALWYENGQPQMEGQFAAGERHGKFTWWHPNGQRQLAGEFDHGKKTGLWTWWHESGMKATEGNHLDDAPTGEWRWWNNEGLVTQRKDLSADPANDPVPLVKPSDSTGELPPGKMEDIGDSILNPVKGNPEQGSDNKPGENPPVVTPDPSAGNTSGNNQLQPEIAPPLIPSKEPGPPLDLTPPGKSGGAQPELEEIQAIERAFKPESEPAPKLD